MFDQARSIESRSHVLQHPPFRRPHPEPGEGRATFPSGGRDLDSMVSLLCRSCSRSCNRGRAVPMPTFVRCLASTFGLLLAAITAASAEPVQYREGTHEGADFMISVPPNWNGGLVMYAHGYQGELPGRGNVEASPMSG